MVFERTREAINNYGAKGAAGFLGLLSLYDLVVGNYERSAMEASLSAILYKTASFYKAERESIDSKQRELEDSQIELRLKENALNDREKSLKELTVYIQEQNGRLNEREVKFKVDDSITEKLHELERQYDAIRKLVSDDRDVLMLIRKRKQYLEDEDDPEIVDLLARTDIDRFIGKKNPM